MSDTTLYKVLDHNRESIYGKGRWTPGRWRSVHGKLVPCERGLHLCRLEHLFEWLGPQIWLAEYDGELIECDDTLVVRRARIVGQTAWNETSARLFAADCAERVLPIFEAAYPNDDRPRKAIEAARAYARGEIGDAARAAARAAAWTAASDAARAAARAAERRWQTERLGEYLEGPFVSDLVLGEPA